MEEEKLVKLKWINDPEQLKEILLKKYTNDEVNYYYKDNLHYSLEYSYYWEKSGGEGGGLLKELEDAITDYFSVKHHVMDLMKEESSHYKDYEDDLPRVINYIDYLGNTYTFEEVLAFLEILLILVKPFIWIPDNSSYQLKSRLKALI